jgi:hypothetical protein
MQEIEPVELNQERLLSQPEIPRQSFVLKMVLFSFLGLVLAGGLVFVGYQLGQRQIKYGFQLKPTLPVNLTPAPNLDIVIPEKLPDLASAVKKAYIEITRVPFEEDIDLGEVLSDREWAYGSFNIMGSTQGGTFIAHIQEGSWKVYFISSPEFYQLVQEAPDNVVPKTLKNVFQEHQ